MEDNSVSNYNFEKHWDNAYQKTSVDSLGWYEEDPIPSMDLISECNLPKDALIFNAGVGAATLIELLLNEGHTNIVVNDIAASALEELKNNLSEQRHSQVKFILDDLTNQHTVKHMAISTHGGILRNIVHHFLPPVAEPIPIPNCVLYLLSELFDFS